MPRLASLALAAALLATPVLADEVTGEVLAYDRVAELIILNDRSVWSLRDGGATAPEGLEAGDRVTIAYQTVSDNGFGKITSVTVVE